MAGGIRLTTLPAVAPVDLELRYIAENSVSTISDRVPAGTHAVIYRTQIPRVYQLSVNDIVCSGQYVVKAERRTLLIVAIQDAGRCGVTVTGETPY